STAGPMGDLFGELPNADALGETGTAQTHVIQVDGGTIVAARWADGTAFDRPLTAVEGTIRERGTGQPIAGVVVQLQHTPYQAVTGADGSFHIADVYPGLYEVAAVDSAWAPFDLGRPIKAQLRAEEGRVTPARLEMDGRVKLTQDRCDLMGSAVGPS